MNARFSIGKKGIFPLLLFTTVALLFSQALLIATYYSALPLLDKWHILEPQFNKLSLWAGFSFQHGPHRLGLISWIESITMPLSQWNMRADAHLQLAIYVVCTALALRLKWRLYRQWHWLDLAIPLLFLHLSALDTLLILPFVHGLVPLFALLAVEILLAKDTPLRFGLGLLWIASASFTGFAAVVVPLYCLFSFRFFGRWQAWANCLLGGGLAIYILLSNTAAGSLPPMELSATHSLQYVLLLVHQIFLNSPSTFNLILAGLVAGFGLWGVFKLLRQSKEFSSKTAVPLLLIGSMLLFALLNWLGRGDMALGNALASRYAPLGMCFGLGLYFTLLHFNGKKSFVALSLCFIGLLVYSQSSLVWRLDHFNTYRSSIRYCASCLVEKETLKFCERHCLPQLHPKPERIDLRAKLEYLRENQWSIWSEERELKTQP